MKTSALIPLLATSVALSACDGAKGPATEQPEATLSTADVSATPTFPDGKPVPGIYEVTFADGTTNLVELFADGSATWKSGKDSGTGSWRFDEEGNYCSSFGETPETCYRERIDANGVWSSTSIEDPAKTATVVRIKPD